MINDLKTYHVMKESGVPWLGNVPHHWELVRLGALVRERGETNEKGLVSEVLSVTWDRGVIPYAEKGNIGNKKSEDTTRYKIVRPNDIVVNCMNVIIGSVGISKYTGCLSPVYYVLTSRNIRDDPRYLNAYFQTKIFQESLVRIGNGILAHRMRIPMELLKCEVFPRPPADEQAAIVRFLDHADRRIRNYVRVKQKLIKLAEELKQAIIQRTVTRDRNQNVRFKASGVECLGDVPERWEIVPLKSVASIQSGLTLGKAYSAQRLEEFPYLRVANVQAGHVNLKNVKRIMVPPAEAGRCTLQVGDVLMTEGGDPDKLGRGSVWEGAIAPCLHQNHIFAVRPRLDRLRPYFLAALLGTAYAKTYFLRNAKQTTNLASTNKTTIGKLPVLLPSVEEQAEILELLHMQTASIQAVELAARREIGLVNQYRIRLFTDVVTGKLDVRTASNELPEELQEMATVANLDEFADRDEAEVEAEFDEAAEEAEA